MQNGAIGIRSKQNAAKWHQIGSERSKLAPNQCRTQLFGPKSKQNGAKDPTSLQNDPRQTPDRPPMQKALESMSPKSMQDAANWNQNRSRKKQHDTKSLQKAANGPPIESKRSDLTRINAEHSKSTSQQICTKLMQNAHTLESISLYSRV